MRHCAGDLFAFDEDTVGQKSVMVIHKSHPVGAGL